ncbi:MAG: hypothetical protein V3V00_03490 [Saprospiraceae bacterium]
MIFRRNNFPISLIVLFLLFLLGLTACKGKIIEQNQNTELSSLNTEGHILAFYTEEIGPEIMININSEHGFVFVNNGKVLYKNKEISSGTSFYINGDSQIRATKNGAEIWRWDFSKVSKNSGTSSPNHIQNIATTTDGNRNPLSTSSTQHQRLVFGNLDTIINDGNVVFRMEKLYLLKDIILNGVNGEGVAIAAMLKGNINVIHGDFPRAYTEPSESWTYAYKESNNIVVKTESEIIMVYVLPSHMYGQPSPLPSLISKATRKAKGIQKIILDIKM